jgi:hypothetical protein
MAIVTTFSSNKVVTLSIISLVILLDDLEFYQYHQANYSEVFAFTI